MQYHILLQFIYIAAICVKLLQFIYIAAIQVRFKVLLLYVLYEVLLQYVLYEVLLRVLYEEDVLFEKDEVLLQYV